MDNIKMQNDLFQEIKREAINYCFEHKLDEKIIPHIMVAISIGTRMGLEQARKILKGGTI